MYGLPSPHNSESSSAYVKEEDKNRCGCKLSVRVYFGITRKQVLQEWERRVKVEQSSKSEVKALSQ